MSLSVSKLVGNLLAGLDKKQREVLEGRYGLKDGASQTLAELGDKYGVTRERIRQVEALALKEAKKAASKAGVFEFVSLVKNHLNNVGGVRRDLLLLNDLKAMVADPKTPHFGNKAHFLLEVSGEPKLSRESENFYDY